MKIPEDRVDGRLVGDAAVPESVKVELQGAKFDNRPIRHVVDLDGGKVGIARSGAEAGEFRVGKMNSVTLLLFRVGPAFQPVGFDGLLSVTGGGLCRLCLFWGSHVGDPFLVKHLSGPRYEGVPHEGSLDEDDLTIGRGGRMSISLSFYL